MEALLAHAESTEGFLAAPIGELAAHVFAGADASNLGFTVDPSGQRLLLVVPDEKAPSPITVVLNWPSLLAKE